MEYELLDTGVFADNRYFDILIEYGKSSPDDILICVTACNRAQIDTELWLVPTLWFPHSWTAGDDPKPVLFAGSNTRTRSIVARQPQLGEYCLFCDRNPQLLFTQNDTNPGKVNETVPKGYFKDGINEYIVHNDNTAVNRELTGTKAAALYRLRIQAGQECPLRLRLRAEKPGRGDPFRSFDKIMAQRRHEADEFYDSIVPTTLSRDEANVMRQGLAGMLWSKQYYNFDVGRWLDEHPEPPPRNTHWFHMVNSDVLSMPDKWEYPWYAAWDLAFHTVPLALVDLDFAKKQLDLILSGVYLHPNGHVPAYEWNFSDVNPPVHAWAAVNLVAIEREERGKPDQTFLKLMFTKLLMNFTWWVNRKDMRGNNIFQGGFLGLDNVGLFDRSNPLPMGGCLEQADGTAWMAFFCQNMLQIALELAMEDETYVEMALKFVEHFLWISAAMDRVGAKRDDMWDEEDGFFYDVYRMPNGLGQRLKVRSIVGLLPLCATTVLEEATIKRFPQTLQNARAFIARHSDLTINIAAPNVPGHSNRRLLAILNEKKLRRVLARMLDENQFLSSYGIRSLSREYQDRPFRLALDGGEHTLRYLPAESDTGMFGGNSNWRGPIWFPLNFLILRALYQFYLYYGNDFKVQCPTGSGHLMTLYEVASEIGSRLQRIFLRDKDGHRPLYGGAKLFQEDPHWRDLILFYEYFNGDNGAGIGASHQTRWTALVSRLLELKAFLTPDVVLNSSTAAEALQHARKAA